MKHRERGIIWKIFIYLLVFVLVMVVAITLAQTYAIEKSYENDRIDSVRRLAGVVFSQTGSTSFAGEDFEHALNGVAMHEDCCIHVLDSNGATVYSSQNFRNCMVHRMSQQEITDLLAEVDAATDKTAIRHENRDVMVFGKPKGNTPDGVGHGSKQNNEVPPEMASPTSSINMESLTYAAAGQNARGEECYVLVGTTVTPLDSTVLVLRQQMGVVVVFLAAAAALLALIMARSVAQPIIDINRSAKELTRRNYDVTFNTRGYREISELRDTLNEAAVELNKTEELRRDLMANVSHDLRTPLTMIVGYGEVMRDLPGENTPENVQVIIDEANRLGRLVEDMLDLSRLEANADEMNLEPVNLTQAVDDMVRRCARMTEKEGYRIEFEAEQDAWVMGDELRLSQVVYNLIGNAITHTGSGHRVQVHQQIEAGWVRISVADDGEGIPPEKLGDIWQRYYKVDKVHKRSRVGTGLGLSIVQAVVEKHGGRTGVESTPGAGSTFWFSLPLYLPE